MRGVVKQNYKHPPLWQRGVRGDLLPINPPQSPFAKGEVTSNRFVALFVIPFILLLALLLTACEEEKTTGAVKVRWDREICARCAMAVSDRNFSAQVRGGREGKKAKVYKFDDLGCAVIWLDKQNWKDAPRTEIWVNNHKDGKWINAKTAWYVEMKNTPMDYGLGAQVEKIDGAIDYEQAVKHIYKVEERFNSHTGLPAGVVPDVAPDNGTFRKEETEQDTTPKTQDSTQ